MKRFYLLAGLIIIFGLSSCAASPPDVERTSEPTTAVVTATVPKEEIVVTSVPATPPVDSDYTPEDLLNIAAMVGNWHIARGIPSGYANRYSFYPNMTFAYFKNSMDGMDRLIAFYGDWDVRDDCLTLSIRVKEMLEGGVLEPAFGSVATEYYIEGGEYKLIYLDEPEVMTLELGPVGVEELDKDGWDAITAVRREIGEAEFWKFDWFSSDQYCQGEIYGILENIPGFAFNPMH